MDKPLHILLVTDGLAPFVVGGMQAHSMALVRGWSELGVKVTVVHTGYHQQEKPTWLADENISEIIVPFEDNGKIPGHYLKASKRHSQFIYEAVQPILDQEVDFIYCKGFTTAAFVAHKNELKVPLGINFHGYEMFQPTFGWKNKIIARSFRSEVKKLTLGADVVFSYGGKITEIIQEIGVDRSHIAEIPAAISLEFSKTPAEEKSNQTGKKLLFVGRDEPRKGLPDLEKAMGLLPDEYHLTVVGVQKDNQPKVTYHGTIQDKAELLKIYDQHDLLIVPSYSEGMPNVIMEALARNMKVLATPVGAIPVWIQKGWVKELNREALSNGEALEQLLQQCLNLPAITAQELEAMSYKNISQQVIEVVRQLQRK